MHLIENQICVILNIVCYLYIIMLNKLLNKNLLLNSYKCREGSDIGLFIPIVPIHWLNNFGDFLLNVDGLVHIVE